MKYKFYTTTEKAWLAMLEAIRGAKRSIYLESFILVDDEKTHDFFKFLKQKAKEGVRVKIIVDRIGNFFWGGFLNKEEFEKEGAEVLFFDRWFYHNHRKVLIVDGEIGFIGGVTIIKGSFANWLDLHLKISGHRVVRALLRSFSRVYYLAEGKDPEILSFMNAWLAKGHVALHRVKLWLIEHWPIKSRLVLQDYYKKKCAEAKRSIVIVTPYFVPQHWLIKALRQASQRGVVVEVVLPQKSDLWMTTVANHTIADALRDHIKFLFIPEMIHAKVLLVDDREGLVGSNNIDSQSFDFNLEASLVFQRKDMIGDLKQILERWKKMAIPLERIDRDKKWYHKLLGFFIMLFHPIL